MRKVYLLSFLLCLCLTSFGQTTVYIYATGAPGSYTTGSSSVTTRLEGSMVAIPFAQRTYAVFDLASNLPAGASIISADLGFDIASVGSTGGPGNTIRGFNGQLSTVTVPSTLYSDMSGSAPTIYGADWPSAAGDAIMPSVTTAVTFLQNCFSGGTATGFASVIWAAGSGMGGLSYTIVDEGGTATTDPGHAPYLKIVYDCPSLATTATAPTGLICANTPFVLSGSAVGATSYLWSGPDGYTSTLASPTVAGGYSITTTYTLTASNSTGCSMSDFATVVINPEPVSTISALGSTALCTGENVTLFVPTSTGDTYQWFDGPTAIPGATDPSYIADGTGSFKVLVTDAMGCTSTTPVATNTILFDGTAQLTPSSLISLCAGNSGIMSVDVNGVSSGINFQWKQAGVDIPGATNSTYSTTTPGFFSVALDIPATTCMVNSDTDTVVVNAYPVPAVTMTGGMIKTSNAYAVYQWFLNTIAIPGATSYAVAPTSNGSYRVRVTDVNGCTAFSESFPYTTSGVAHLNRQDISIYPNPAHGELHVESPEQVRAVITGIEGRKLIETTDVKGIDISKLATGMYMISLYDEAGMRIAVQQFVKE